MANRHDDSIDPKVLILFGAALGGLVPLVFFFSFYDYVPSIPVFPPPTSHAEYELIRYVRQESAHGSVIKLLLFIAGGWAFLVSLAASVLFRHPELKFLSGFTVSGGAVVALLVAVASLQDL